MVNISSKNCYRRSKTSCRDSSNSRISDNTTPPQFSSSYKRSKRHQKRMLWVVRKWVKICSVKIRKKPQVRPFSMSKVRRTRWSTCEKTGFSSMSRDYRRSTSWWLDLERRLKKTLCPTPYTKRSRQVRSYSWANIATRWLSHKDSKVKTMISSMSSSETKIRCLLL